MGALGTDPRSLRYCICQQSKLLNIHPKNITRWFGMEDL
jgi:hypothetical protein